MQLRDTFFYIGTRTESQMALFVVFYELVSWVASIYWGFTWGFAANSVIGWQVVWSLVATILIKLVFEAVLLLVVSIISAGSGDHRDWQTTYRVRSSTRSATSIEQAGKSIEERYRLKRESLARGLTTQEVDALRAETAAQRVDAEKARLEKRIRTAPPLPPPE